MTYVDSPATPNREGILAVIPARGGSKGLPRKNIRDLAGKPLLAWAITAARNTSMIDRIVVSTDDPEIAEVGDLYGALPIIRPDDISGDFASSELAILHALDFLESTENYRPELVVFLQCTSPLTAPDDIDGTINALLVRKADSAFAVTIFHHFLWSEDMLGSAVGVNHDPRTRQMRQQRDPYYLETGAVYVMRVVGFKSARHRFFGRIAMHQIPRERALEIDDEYDLFLASQILSATGKMRRFVLSP